MATRKASLGDFYWPAMSWVSGAIAGGIIAFVFAEFYGAGWRSGAALGGLVFLASGWIFSRNNASALPPPNSRPAPTAPPGGAYNISRTRITPEPPAQTTPHAAPEPQARDDAFRDDATRDPDSTMAKLEAAPGKIADAVEDAAASINMRVRAAAREAGAAARGLVGSDESAEADAPTTGPSPGAATDPAPLAAPVETRRPGGLDGPRDGTADDLKRIRGVGPRLEEMLHGLGYYHFDQLAAWTPAEIAWVDENLEGFHGRVSREDWVGQSRILAEGGETEHSQRVDRGEAT